MKIRSMRTGDLDAVLALEEATYAQPWPRQVFADELASQHRYYLVAEHEQEVVGYGGLMLVDHSAHITTLVSQRPGPVPAVGTRLMLALIDHALGQGCGQLTLEVRVSNRQAQDFYRKFGLGPVGVRKHFYIDEDALIMWVHDLSGEEYRARLRKIREELP